MKLEFDQDDLRRLAAPIVAEALVQIQAEHSKLNGKLAFNESEAAELLGIARHSLRDLRLNGRIEGKRLGRRITYSKQALERLLAESSS